MTIQTAQAIIVGIRITGVDKHYHLSQLKIFAENLNWALNRDDIVRVEFGRQDSRGGISICLVDDKTCVTQQKFFDSKDDMLGFVCGFNSANSDNLYI